jgi:hypothetical protein
MLMSPVGLKSEKGCAGHARQKLNSTDSTSRQRGRPTSINPKLSKDIENGKNWSRVSGGCLIPRRTDRPSVGRNITLTLTCPERSRFAPTVSWVWALFSERAVALKLTSQPGTALPASAVISSSVHNVRSCKSVVPLARLQRAA